MLCVYVFHFIFFVFFFLFSVVGNATASGAALYIVNMNFSQLNSHAYFLAPSACHSGLVVMKIIISVVVEESHSIASQFAEVRRLYKVVA